LCVLGNKITLIQNQVVAAAKTNGHPSIILFQVNGTKDTEKIKTFARRLAQVCRLLSTDSGVATCFVEASNLQVAEGLKAGNISFCCCRVACVVADLCKIYYCSTCCTIFEPHPKYQTCTILNHIKGASKCFCAQWMV
jgi:hypothetical protein